MIMKQVNDNMIKSFQDQVDDYQGKITRQQFVGLYIATFVGVESTASSEQLKRAVNDTSLIDVEADFMLACIDSQAKGVKQLLDIYEQYERLPNCQLGDVLRRCLDVHQELVFCD